VLLVNEATGQELAELAAPGVELRPEPANTGFAGGHNRVLAELFDGGADGVLVLNPDLSLAFDALAELWRAAQHQDGRCLVGPLLEAGDEELRGTGLVDSAGIRWTVGGRHLDALQGRPLRDAPRETVRVPGLTGASLLVPRPAYELIVAKTGELFDEDFLAYREDAELALRCAALDIPSYLCPTAKGVHRRGLKGTSRRGSTAVNRLGVQNRFLLLFKHGRRRPGNPLAGAARDLVVLVGAATIERSSWPGVRQAWALRGRMHEKRRAFDEGLP